MKKTTLIPLLTTLLALLPLGLLAQISPSEAAMPGGGYRGDQVAMFEDFDAMKVDRKEPSFWHDPKKETPAEQLAYAKEREAKGSRRSARNAYNDLVHEWHASPQAAEAQLSFARLHEEADNLEQAYNAYIYLVVYYAGQCDYNKVLDSCYRLANSILLDNTGLFGLRLATTAYHRENFERILYYAPRWHRAPEVLLTIGALHEKEKSYPMAAKVYDTILMRFPASKEVELAAYRSAYCHYTEALIQKENEARCRDSIMAINALLNRYPQHPRAQEIKLFKDELTQKLEDLRYHAARFYDSPQQTRAATIAAYERFLKEYPDSTRALEVQKRLNQLRDPNFVPKK